MLITFAKTVIACRLIIAYQMGVQTAPHKPAQHFLWWNEYITEPIGLIEHHAAARDAMVLLKFKILKNLLLKRTKKKRAADLLLPLKIVELRKTSLDSREYNYYQSLLNEAKLNLNECIQAGTNCAMLRRLQKAADYPYLVEAPFFQYTDSGNIEQSCSVCHNAVNDPIFQVTSCSHMICNECLIDSAASIGLVPVVGKAVQRSCPSCAKEGASNSKSTIEGAGSSNILNRIRRDGVRRSTKIEALMEEILDMGGSAKGIVFTQFTSVLVLIEDYLKESRTNYVPLVGSMSLAERDSAVARFNEEPDCKILLTSFKAGDVSLSLTGASHVFLMEPCLNPLLELQAQERVHRIGQYRTVRVVRFVMENTIEETILQSQEKKKEYERRISSSYAALERLPDAVLKSLLLRDYI